MPDVVVSCDWSTKPDKRWKARATRAGDGPFVVDAPALADAGHLIEAERALADGGWVLAGFDAPIGVPRAYGQHTGLPSFPAMLGALGGPRWEDFFAICDLPDEIRVARPFFPRVPGRTAVAELAAGLDIPIPGLRRRCERRTPNRAPACPLFWTLGANQVGRAAISCWQDVLLPARAADPNATRLWPFDGPLEGLLDPEHVVLAETYPKESQHHVGIVFEPGQGKRQQCARAAQALALQQWLHNHGCELTPTAAAMVANGFGPGAAGEDPFDAFVGLLGMLEVVLGVLPDGVPLDDPPVLEWEGWILGQQDAP